MKRISAQTSLRRITAALLAGTALTLIAVAHTPARADGGAGGTGNGGADLGSAGGTGFNGQAGDNAGMAGAQGGAGGGGAGGGQGGEGTNPGGAGGTAVLPDGADGISSFVGSGGGGGYHGNGFTGVLGGNLIGGNGGRGGDSSQLDFGAAGGGAGGYGALTTTGGSVSNTGTVTGGNGGAGGLYVGAGSQATDGNGGSGGIGVLLTTGGETLTNSGTITGGNGGAGVTQGTAGDGVVGNNGLTVINTSTGTISAGTGGGITIPYAIRVDNGDLTLTNAGTVNGTVASIFGEVIATNSGSMTGSIAISAATGLNLTNTASGTISGASVGISSGGISVINNAGTIDGGSGIGIAADFLTLVNSGTISVTAFGVNTAVGALSDANITNTATGQITGGSYGLNLFGSSVVNNAGNISAVNAAIIGNGDLTVVNAGTGVISGVGYGIQSCNCTLLTVVNAGLITGTITAAISASTVDITNTGTISSGSGAGIETLNGGTISNAAGATISGFAFGINVINSSVTVTNAGTISADLTTFGSRAITAAQDITLVNEATGVISGNEGVRAEGLVNVTNLGTINAQDYAIRAQLGFSSVYNAGSISGGGDGGNVAILFSGSDNTLTLAPGSSITGQVLGTGNDAFVLGGAGGTGTLDASRIGGTGQYQGFSTFTKTDGSTWVLTGTPAQATSWTINGGTLSVSSNVNLGNANEDLSINGGILQVTGTIFNSTPRTINWGASGGGFDIADAANTFTISQVIGPGGPLQKLGAGTLVLTAANTYTGATTVSAGTLSIAAGGGITSDVTNNAIFNNAGTVTGNLTNTGSATNTAIVTGAVANSGSFGNAATGVVGGSLTNITGTATNAGTINGGVTVASGALTTIGTIVGGLTNSGLVNANGGAINGFISNSAGTFNVGGTVTSDSAFTNANGATLSVGGSGNYTLGGLLTNSGALTVATGGSLTATAGGITNNAGGTIANNGTIVDDLNNAGIVINNGVYAANVATNSGAITNSATGTWTGNVASNTGAVTNNGTWAGSITSSGMVSGSGTVSNLTITGGTFAPGSGAPGSSMNVTGNITLTAAATYLVQLNPTTSSFANVSGTATLGGATVNAVYANGSYVARQYTILTAGSRNGTFNTLVNTNLPSNFASSLSYDANNAYLDLKLGFNVPAGLNQNQTNVANALVNFFNTTGGIPLAFGALSPAGLTQVSGELGTGTQQATFDAMGLFMSLMTDPFAAGRGDGAGSPGGAFGYADEALGYAAKRHTSDAMAAIYRKAPPLVAPSFEQRWRVWGAGFGGSQTTDGNATLGSNSATSRIFAGAVGLDYRFSPYTVAGIALAGGGTNYSVANSGTGRSDLFQAGAFVRHNVGASYITAALAYGWQDVTTDRSVGADRLSARFNTDAFSGRVEAGHRFVDPTLSMGLTPYVAGQFTTISLPNYAETSGVTNTFGLNYAGKDVTASRSELGLRTDKSYGVADGVLTLRGRAAWAHNFNPDRSISATFQTLPGASFVVNGAAQARDAALVTASAEMKWRNNWVVAATFEGEFSDVTRSYAGKGVVRYAW